MSLSSPNAEAYRPRVPRNPSEAVCYNLPISYKINLFDIKFMHVYNMYTLYILFMRSLPCSIKSPRPTPEKNFQI